MAIQQIPWQQTATSNRRAFVCGYCGNHVASAVVYVGDANHWIYICPYCHQPTYFEFDKPTPGAMFGNTVDGVPNDVNDLYNEARRCMTVSAFTSAVLACRKILMNLAVGKGAKEGQPFIDYVEYLAQKGYVPPEGKGWVDHIRKKGNEATHEISPMSESDAKDLITFAEMLLKFVYEFPSRIPPTP
jgi:hypothetical protein